MKTHKKIGSTFRPLLITTVVGLVCQQYAMAQTTPAPTPAAANERTSPFAPRPPHMDNFKIKTGKVGIPSNVLFLIDDSGSMQTEIARDRWATQDRCTWSVEYNRRNKNKCFYIFYYPMGGWLSGQEKNGARNFYTFREPTRIQAAIDGMNAMLDNPKYKGQISWGIYSLWGTERRFWQMGGKPDWGRAWDTLKYKDAIPGFQWTSWDNRWKTYEIPTFLGFRDNPADVYDLVNSLSPYMDTPTTDRYVRAVREVRKNIKYRCQKNFIVVLSDGDANTDEIPGYPMEWLYTNPTGFLQWEKDYYGTFTRWGSDENNGPWYNYFAPGQTTRTAFYHPYYGRTNWGDENWNGIGLFSRMLASKDIIGKNGRSDIANDGKDAEGGDWNDPKYEKQLIETYAIGFGDSLTQRGITYLKGAATCSDCYHKARTGEELRSIFEKILDKIAKPEEVIDLNLRSTATPAVAGSSIAAIAASATVDTKKWSSVLLFSWFNSSGTEILPGNPDPAKYNERSVFIVNNGREGGGNIYDLQAVDTARKVDFGLTSDEEYSKAFVPWIKRDPAKSDAQIQADAAKITSTRVSKYRIRTDSAIDVQRQMGDVLGSPIIALGKDEKNRQKYVITAANDGLLYVFRSTGAESQGTSPYSLKLNYLPAGMQRESKDDTLTVGKTLPLIAEEGYGQSEVVNPHLYLNNGGIAWILTPKTNGHKQEFVLLGNMGQGGRGAYALSVAGEKRSGSGNAGLDAPESTWLTNVPMWETAKGNGNGLGYTVSTATIAQTATKWDRGTKKAQLDQGVRIYAYLANGYRPGTYDDEGKFTPNLEVTAYDKTPTLYVYEMMGQEFGTGATSASSLTGGARPGTIVNKISVPSGPDVGPGALSSPTLVDTDLDGVVDIAYAGDEFGNLYRFDLRGDVNTWKATMIYKGDKTRPITAAPTVYRNDENNYIVVFGTGSDVFKHDRRDAHQQMIAGIYDDLKVESPTALNFGGLFTQSYTGTDKERYIADAGFDKARHKGWKIMLDPSVADKNGYFVGAEKVVSKPAMLLTTAFVPTRIYGSKDVETKLPPGVDKNKTCYESESSKDTKGTSWTMAINVKNGAGPDLQNGGYYTDPQGNPLELAGKNHQTITSGMNIIDAKKVEPTLSQQNGNGEYSTSGEATDLKEPNIPRNDCIAKTAVMENIQSTNDPQNPSGVSADSLGGKRCGDPSFTRGTKREIIL